MDKIVLFKVTLYRLAWYLLARNLCGVVIR